MSETPSQAYISKAHLKGYKSIKDLEIDLKPGLNIIIGPNGSGKTNFLEGLNSVLHSDIEDFKSGINCKIDFVVETKSYLLDFSVKQSKKVREGQEVKLLIFDADKKQLFENEFLKIGNREIHSNAMLGGVEHLFSNPFQVFSSLGLGFNNEANLKLLRFGINQIFSDAMSKPFTYTLNDNNNFEDENYLNESSLNFFGETKFNEEKSKIIEMSVNPLFSDILQNYSPIQDIEFDIDDVKVVNGATLIDEDDFELHTEFQNLKIKFIIGGSLREWNMLSDGTKRIFYLLYSIFTSKTAILFLEEPELGIHPDQLYKLMDFIKEQSKEKQIIITTHSPEVLNILEKDELDHIIVTHYDNEKGTQMHHLSPKRIKKGQLYMKKVGHLSDFWVHSNLEELDDDEN